MTTTTWLAGFAVFLLFALHFSLFVSFRSRCTLWLSLAWLGNCLYIYFEYQSDKGRAAPQIPYLISSFLLVFFVLADREINWYSLRRAASFLIVGLALVVVPGLVAYGYSGSFFVYTVGGAAVSAAVFFRLGYSFRRLELNDLHQLFLRDTEGILYKESGGGAGARFLPVDNSLKELEASARRTAANGRAILSSAFIGFGLLQLAYPLRAVLLSIPETGRLIWVGLFVVGMFLKLSTGAGFVVLLASHARWVEVLKRKTALSQELARITASVEHDMRGPIGELNTIILQLEEKAKAGDSRYSPFLLEQAKYLSFVQAKIRTVMEMILAMRESPEEFERRKQVFSIGDPLKQAMHSVKLLHEKASPVFRTEGLNTGLRVAGNSKRLAQAFRNILNNAVEASIEKNSGTRPVVYITSAVKDRGTLQVIFKDDGVGIDPTIQHRIMEAGVSTKRDSPTPNRGLGLYIAKHLVAIHGGGISFLSMPNEGTTVTVELPLNIDERSQNVRH